MQNTAPAQHLSLKTFCVFLPVAVFFFISVYYIAFHHVSPLSRDQWHMYAPYFRDGWWQAALTPMSHHRHIVPFLMFHIDMQWFGGLNHFLTAFGAFFNLCIVFLLGKVIQRHDNFSPLQKSVLIVFTLTCLTWLINIAQLGWGFMSTMYYLSSFTYLLALYCAWHALVNRAGNKWFAAAIGCGIVCTFSFGIGILVWPALLVLCAFWRVPLKTLGVVVLVLLICLVVFLSLPGSDEIKQAVLWQPWQSIRFVFLLAAGPLFYLLKSFHLFDAASIKTFASLVSVIVTSLALLMFVRQLLRNQPVNCFASLCYGLMMLGLGTAALISLTRPVFFLDVWVDRYQIWAMMFWLGLLMLCYQQLTDSASIKLRQAVLLIMFCWPIAALPSQLDLGARLSEYKIRVSGALLAFQVGLPIKSDAKDAMHWSWEYKLPYFFYVWEAIQQQHKSVFIEAWPRYIHQDVKNVLSDYKTTTFDLNGLRKVPVMRDELVNPVEYPYANNHKQLEQQWPQPEQDIVGYKLYATVPDDIDWDFGLISNQQGKVIGLMQPIHYSPLPRANINYRPKQHNGYGVTDNDFKEKVGIILVNSNTKTAYQIEKRITKK